jgi:hypothetical protein
MEHEQEAVRSIARLRMFIGLREREARSNPYYSKNKKKEQYHEGNR